MTTRFFIRALLALLVSLGAIVVAGALSGPTAAKSAPAAPTVVPKLPARGATTPASLRAAAATCPQTSQSGVVPAGCYQYEIDVIPSFLASDPANRSGLGQGVGEVTFGGGTTLRCLNPADASAGNCRYVGELPVGSTITLTEQPASLDANSADPINSEFGRWGGACTGTGGCSFKLSADHMSVQAYFVPKLVTLTVNAASTSGLDSGAVSIAPTRFGGIPASGAFSCGSQPGDAMNFPCTARVRLDETMRLVATNPSPLINFSDWSGDPCTVVTAGYCRLFMDKDHTVTANYVSYALEKR